MNVVDAHLHVWDTSRIRYPWLEDQPHLGQPFLPTDVHSQLVSRVVFVQADAADGLEEARWVQSLAPSWPQLAGIVAFAPVEDRIGLSESLDTLADLSHVVGVRRLLQDEPPGFVSSGAVVDGLRQLARRHVPFDACVRWHQLGELVEAVKQASGVRLVLDHLGKPPVSAGYDSDERQQWSAALRSLAQHPNVSVKLSGLAPEARSRVPLFPQISPFVSEAFDLFGPDRIIAGSDFPVSAAAGYQLGYDEWFGWIQNGLGLDEAEQVQVLRSSAERTYRLPVVD